MKGGSLKLAAGGQATVWLARVGHDLVARKLPHAHLMDDPEMRSALRREAEIAMRLRHPNVVRMRGIELEDEVPVLVMDYIEGTTLSELVRDWLKQSRGDTTRAAVRIILDAAEGLHALHELAGDRGEPLALVHRDVSPQNVLVGLDGRARVSDFGLTKCLATDRATTEGVLKGKAGYLAPEYVRGQRGDRRQDVFSLAIVAWETLTRGRLFRGENDAQTLDRILTMPIPSIADKAPALAAIAPHIDPVLRRALERDPADRYESAAAFAHSLAIGAERAGVAGTEADVRESFSASLARELVDRRAALSPPRRRGLAIGASAAAIVLIGAATLALSKRAPPDATAVRLQGEPPTSTSTSTVTATSASASASTSTSTSTVTATSASSPASLEVMALPNAKTAAPKSKPRHEAKPATSTVTQPRPNPY